MPTRNELKKLARVRLREAKALLDHRLYDGACYLSGYVVELALKARICKILDLDEYPDTGEISKSFKTHRLDELLKLAGLQKKFNMAKVSVPFWRNWSLVTEWSEQFRYSPVGTNPRTRAVEVINALENEENGILTWIAKHW